MSVYEFSVGSITWRYTLNGANASIGDGSSLEPDGWGNATTAQAALSGTITIPSSLNGYPVTFIKGYAFHKCNLLTSATIPDTVTLIGMNSFRDCTGLRSVTVGKSVATIENYCFGWCTGLTSINIPDSVTSIGNQAFLTTSANLTVTINNGKLGKTSPSSGGSFFGATNITFVLPPAPTITITSSTVTSGSTTNNPTIALTFTSTESTTNFQAVDISLTNGSLNTSFAGSGTVYTATFTPTGQGACTINVAANVFTNAAGRNNDASIPFTWTFDSVSPSMTITSTTTGVISGSAANNAKIALTFTSSESTNSFGEGDISVTNGILSNFAGSGAVYAATFTAANEGVCTIGVAAGAYTDAVGNSNTAATFNWTFSTAWNVGTNSNHLIKSYIKDFIDVSGSVVLRENANLYISGNAETAGSLSLNRLFVTADASFNRRIFVGGDVSMNGTVTVSGDLSMNGTVTKCNFNNSSIPKSAFSSAVPDGADYTTTKIVYDQTFQANDDVSMNGPIVAANNVKVSGSIVFNDGTVMNTYDNNILTASPKVFKSTIFSSLDICGNLVAGSYATSSDYRIKTNVVELDETYTVDKLRPVKYFQTQINREKYGLIAHELQEHYPDLVIGEKDGNELQRVNYTGLIAILINEIKRLKRELTELENDVVVGR